MAFWKTADHIVHGKVCLYKGQGNRVEGGDSGKLRMHGGLMLMDALAWPTEAQQREEGVFFPLTSSCMQQSRQEKAGLCTRLHSFRVIYLIVLT